MRAITLLFLAGLALVAQPPAIDSDDIGGTVKSAKGPEAGVWVIAETTDLPTRYIKNVVTDDRGRYLDPGSAESATTRSGRAATGSWIRPRCRPSRARWST